MAVAKLQTVPAMNPNKTAAAGTQKKVQNTWANKKGKGVRVPTYPEPGVIVTKPAIAPEQKPTTVHFLSMR
jgi:hypothetical protein